MFPAKLPNYLAYFRIEINIMLVLAKYFRKPSTKTVFKNNQIDFLIDCCYATTNKSGQQASFHHQATEPNKNMHQAWRQVAQHLHHKDDKKALLHGASM